MVGLSRRQVLCGAAGAVAAQNQVGAVVTSQRFVRALLFDDLTRFEALTNTPSIATWVSRYLAGASAGLTAYTKANGLTAENFERAIAERPKFYRSLNGLRKRIKPEETAILRAMSRVRQLAPATPPVPVYFFVGTAGPGATVKEVTALGVEAGLGILVPAENVALTSATDTAEFPEGTCGRGDVSALPQLIAHEYAHVAQVQLQGLRRYRSIYREAGRNTHLASAVREGGADFLAYLASGQLRERHRYMLANEMHLWRQFRPMLNQPVSSSTGWFSTPGGIHCGRPAQLGYAIGWAICRHYYETANDKARALTAILSAVEPTDFIHIAQPYRTAHDR